MARSEYVCPECGTVQAGEVTQPNPGGRLAVPRDWLRRVLYGPACRAQHPSGARCHTAPHPPEVAHQSGDRMWDEHGDVHLCDGHGRRATPDDWAQHWAAQEQADRGMGR